MDATTPPPAIVVELDDIREQLAEMAEVQRGSAYSFNVRLSEMGRKVIEVEQWQEQSNNNIQTFWDTHWAGLVKRIDGIETRLAQMETRLSVLMVSLTMIIVLSGVV